MPRKTFTSGEVLTAADTNLYLSNEVTLTSSTVVAYTALTADRYSTLLFSNAAAGTITIGTATAFVAGERVDIIRDGTATLRITAGTGVTLASNNGTALTYEITSRYGAATVLCAGTNTYRVIGSALAV